MMAVCAASQPKTIMPVLKAAGRAMRRRAKTAMAAIRKEQIISVSGRRQITIPQKYFEALGFSNEAECILQNNAIVIRPIRENTGNEFSEQILADLIAQGFSGQELQFIQ